MDTTIKLSVLICSIPQRFDTLQKIYAKVMQQAEGKPVEILVFMDNKKRTIGEKRNAMTSIANGKYFILLDDDDDCSDDYINELLIAADSDADIISFDQQVYISGVPGIVNFSLSNENEEFVPNGITKRKPFSVCAFKTETFKDVSFGKLNYGEDFIFSKKAWEIATSEHHINKVLHTYIYDQKITAAI